MIPTVFVIDDDQAVRDSITLLLNLEQIEVQAYPSAESFLEAYRAEMPGCLVLDIKMPGMDGLELQQELARKLIRIPTIFITGHGDVPMAGLAFKRGAFDFIEKPFNAGRLLERIHEAIERDRQWRQQYSGQEGAATALAELVVEESANEASAQAVPRIEEREWAAMTLHSIGEAVITTDASGVVEYLNPMAERLTGWPSAEAHGQPVERVFNLIDESSRAPLESLVSRAQQQEREAKGEQHTLLLNRHGGELAVEETIAPIYADQGALLGMVITFKDVTAQRRLTQELLHRADHDALTGLVNRREFERRLAHAIAASKNQGARHALCYLDLDQFKVVNDSVGHAAGDELLRQVATLMMAQVRDRDTLARLGGDEFALLLTNCPMEKALQIAESLVAEVGEYRFVWEGNTFQIGVSIGVVAITGVANSLEELLVQADSACYSAKQLGRNRVHLCMREAGIKGRQNRAWIRASSLSSAVEQERFLLHCQSVAPLQAHNDGVIRQELLVRLKGKEGEVVLPGVFIPTAERYGLMSTIDRWVIRSAFQRHHEISPEAPVTEFSINLSGKTLADASLAEFVRRQLSESTLRPEQVCFEISEATLTQNFNQAKHFIHAMKSEGCRIALDDFGSGLSSFAHLKKLPIDYLKIEGGVVRNMLQNSVDYALVEAINKISHTMSVRTVAKWVESEALVGQLREMEIDYAQGYAIAFPGLLQKAGA